MGSEQQHRTKANSNLRFTEAIAALGFSDWTATAIFYCAVHLVEMMFAVARLHTKTHDERDQLLLKQYPEILRHFRPVYNYSLWARYGFKNINPTRDIPMLQQRLRDLEKYVTLEIESSRGQ